MYRLLNIGMKVACFYYFEGDVITSLLDFQIHGILVDI